jgi:hypothetical protein
VVLIWTAINIKAKIAAVNIGFRFITDPSTVTAPYYWARLEKKMAVRANHMTAGDKTVIPGF